MMSAFLRYTANALIVGSILLVGGFVMTAVGVRMRPAFTRGVEFITNPSLSFWARLGCVIMLVGLVLMLVGYARHDEEKIK